MSRNGRVVVAMSGGVDSSVAACLLKEQGYDCVGVFMRVGVADGPAPAPGTHRHGCCSVTDALDARAIAGRLGVPFYALNFQADFERIIANFVSEYGRARTPNPCVHCNIDLKFGKLLRYAELIDAEFVATGHYARIVQRDGAACLARARHTPKDQSYVLFGIRRDDLRRCLFPIGELPDKQAVRELAATLDLPVHDKPDSQEICFVPDQDYRRLVAERAPETRRPGDIRDQAGRVLGRHDGVAGFTIGQRRGLGLAVGLPIYVTELDPATNTVTVGPRDALERGGLVAQQVNWLTDPPGGEVAAAIKIRHMHTPAAGHITPAADGAVTVRFEEPQSAVTPGQAAVFYDDDGIVLGGGWIERALP